MEWNVRFQEEVTLATSWPVLPGCFAEEHWYPIQNSGLNYLFKQSPWFTIHGMRKWFLESDFLEKGKFEKEPCYWTNLKASSVIVVGRDICMTIWTPILLLLTLNLTHTDTSQSSPLPSSMAASLLLCLLWQFSLHDRWSHLSEFNFSPPGGRVLSWQTI